MTKVLLQSSQKMSSYDIWNMDQRLLKYQWDMQRNNIIAKNIASFLHNYLRKLSLILIPLSRIFEVFFAAAAAFRPYIIIALFYNCHNKS